MTFVVVVIAIQFERVVPVRQDRVGACEDAGAHRVVIHLVRHLVRQEGDALIRGQGRPERQADAQHPFLLPGKAGAELCDVGVQVGIEMEPVGGRGAKPFGNPVKQGEQRRQIGAAVGFRSVPVPRRQKGDTETGKDQPEDDRAEIGIADKAEGDAGGHGKVGGCQEQEGQGPADGKAARHARAVMVDLALGLLEQLVGEPLLPAVNQFSDHALPPSSRLSFRSG